MDESSLSIGRVNIHVYLSLYSTCDIARVVAIIRPPFPVQRTIAYWTLARPLMSHYRYVQEITGITQVCTCDRVPIRGLAAYASSASFGHPEHGFLTVWTPKNLSEFADDDFSWKIDVEAVVSLL